MSDFAHTKELDETYVMHTYARLPVAFASGKGAELFDENGKRYIDLLAGVGCTSLGHADEDVAHAVQDQLGKVWQTSNYFYDANRSELAKQLSGLLSTTTDSLGHVTGSTGSTWKSFFSNSGAEANEGAFKVARAHGAKELNGAAGIISAKKSFHGRTLASLAATGQDVFHKKFLPLPAGFYSVPLNDIEALEQALEAPAINVAISPCAVLLECVQGEGGVWPADLEYLQAVRELTHKHNVLLIIDEVQTGFFRTGAPFSFQEAGIEPDVVSMAKGIATGFPTGAVAARDEYADLLVPGDHGSTFGGNALAAAAGLATVQKLQASNIGEHVIETGAHFRERLEALPHVTEVRGRGLMLGAQLDEPIATELVERGLEAGLVLNHIGDSILRFLPPLVITKEQVDEVADTLAKLLA